MYLGDLKKDNIIQYFDDCILQPRQTLMQHNLTQKERTWGIRQRDNNPT